MTMVPPPCRHHRCCCCCWMPTWLVGRLLREGFVQLASSQTRNHSSWCRCRLLPGGGGCGGCVRVCARLAQILPGWRATRFLCYMTQIASLCIICVTFLCKFYLLKLCFAFRLLFVLLLRLINIVAAAATTYLHHYVPICYAHQIFFCAHIQVMNEWNSLPPLPRDTATGYDMWCWSGCSLVERALGLIMRLCAKLLKVAIFVV